MSRLALSAPLVAVALVLLILAALRLLTFTP